MMDDYPLTLTYGGASVLSASPPTSEVVFRRSRR